MNDLPFRAAIALFLAVSIFSVVDHEFVLDAEAVIAGDRIQESRVGEILTTDWWNEDGDLRSRGLYRPVTMLWFAILGLLGDETSPTIFNFGAVVLQIMLGLARYSLLVALLHELVSRRLIALVVTLIVGCHGVAMESVVGILGQAELLAALFCTLSWTAFIRFWREGSVGSGVICVAGMILAALSKETALLFPFVLLVHGLIEAPGGAVAAGRRRLAAIGMTIGSLGLVLALRHAVLGSMASSGDVHEYLGLTSTERILSGLAAMGQVYVPAILWPFNMMPVITHQDVVVPEGFLDSRVLLGAFVWLGLIGGLVLAILRRRVVAAGLLAWAVVSLLPISQFIEPIGVVASHRFIHVALFVAVTGAAVAAERLRERSAGPGKAAWAVLGILGLIGAVGGHRLKEQWRTEGDLAAYGVSINKMNLWALGRDIATNATGDSLTNEQRMAEFERLQDVRDELKRIPSTGRLDRRTGHEGFEILMDHSAFLGNFAAGADDFANAQHLSIRAEKWAEPDRSRMLEARLRTLELKVGEFVAYLQAENLTLEDREFRLSDLSTELIGADEMMTPDESAATQAKLLVLGFKIAQLRGETADALRRLDEALKVDPGNGEVLAQAADAAFRAENHRRVLELTDQALDHDSASITLCDLAARTADRLRRPADARRYRRKILVLRPTSMTEANLQQRLRQLPASRR